MALAIAGQSLVHVGTIKACSSPATASHSWSIHAASKATCGGPERRAQRPASLACRRKSEKTG